MNKPPFNLTSLMLNYVISISEKIGQISNYNSIERMPILRRNNEIYSIHSSLAIENNTLSLDQVRDIINGHKVIGPQNEIIEVKNAYKVYEDIDLYNPYKEDDLLKAHKDLMSNLIDDAGNYRDHGKGVFKGNKLIFMAPPKDLVPSLMNNLFLWLNLDKETPILIKSCIFHYEFVFIHPFSDGNGRIARFWQNTLLISWNKIFKYLPIENQIKKYQKEYYQSIEQSNINGNSNVFIEFMLKMIDETLLEFLDASKKESISISSKINDLLNVLEYDIPLSANEIMKKLNIKSKETLRNSYLNPAIKNGLVKMTLPDKHNSKNQKYYK